MRLSILTVQDVAETQKCCGCGVCGYLDPQQVEMVDDMAMGRRPYHASPMQATEAQQQAVAACPGIALEHDFDRSQPGLVESLADSWGPILQVWEGYASDPMIRKAGSSGGAATALALFAIEQAGMHGVLHIDARPDMPIFNRTVLSTHREQLLAATGSRYAPASPCDGLQQVEDAPAPCVFIGKPCDVAATAKARKLRPQLDANLGLTIGIFCAGTPSTQGTMEMIRAMGIDDPAQVKSIRYRGNGWPGLATVRYASHEGEEHEKIMTYAESWGGVLQKRRQWRCYVCADHTGEFADIAVGDPWYRPIEEGDPGRSMVIARTPRGRDMIQRAMDAGYLTLEVADPSILPRSQDNLEQVRGSVWGRNLICRFMGAQAPRYRNLPMAGIWLKKLSFKEKIRSTVGTAKRVLRKRLRERIAVNPYRAKASNPTPSPVTTSSP